MIIIIYFSLVILFLRYADVVQLLIPMLIYAAIELTHCG